MGALANGFNRPSCSIELRVKKFEYNEDYFHGPSYFQLPILRILIHEITHFWQAISLGFVTNLCLEDWRAILDFEKDQQTVKLDKLKKALHSQDDKLGISPNDLLECLARYWDVHILGPVLVTGWAKDTRDYQDVSDTRRVVEISATRSPYGAENFHAAMIADPSYALPYKLAVEQHGFNTATVLFPLAAYYALQTPHPIPVYKELLPILAKSIDLPPNVVVPDAWRSVFPKVHGIIDNVLLQYGTALTPGWDVLFGSLARTPKQQLNPLFRHIATRLDYWLQLMGSSYSTYAFAFPADPAVRYQLTKIFPPPLVLFVDGRWAMDAEPGAIEVFDLLRKQLGKEPRADATMFDGVTNEALADQSQEILERSRRMRSHNFLSQLSHQ
jgi:hypothetical protein